jgi:colanic acid biosynthesis glycosyl transferase WcaI
MSGVTIAAFKSSPGKFGMRSGSLSKMKTRILFTEQFYYPEGWGGAQIPRDITTFLASNGFQVEVLCGSEQYAPCLDDSTIDPARFGIRIHRVPALFPGDIHRSKGLRTIWFCIAALPMIIFRRRVDVIMAQTNPPPLILLLALLSRLQRRRFIIIAQDIYPEVMIAYGLLNSSAFAARALSRAFAWAYRRADAVVALGPRMAERLVNKGVASKRIWHISNWASGDTQIVSRADNELVTRWGLGDKFTLLYSGNLGAAHDCETLIRAVAYARSDLANLQLVIIGGGSRIPEARRLVADLAIEDNVTFESFVPLHLLPKTLGLADLAVVTLLPGFDGLVVPSKLLGLMARGIATLYIGPAQSDVDTLLAQSHGGISVRNGDIAMAAKYIVNLASNPAQREAIGDAARNYYEQHLSSKSGLEQYRRLVSKVLEDN